jgi:cytoskeletal protein CcmA (bactofilin family)
LNCRFLDDPLSAAFFVSKPDKALLTCPHCGHQQSEARAAFSAVCKECGQYLRVQELLKPSPKALAPAREQKRIACFECAAEFDVPASAQSTMCKKCSCYIDLHDYSINNAVSKNFKTKGSFVVQATGYVFNSETVASEAAIKGRFIGKLVVERSLTLYSSAQIKGSLSAACLIVPPANQVRWNGEMKVGSAEIEGELVANLHVDHGVHVKPHGRLLGTLQAKSLVADLGAVLSVDARFGP